MDCKHAMKQLILKALEKRSRNALRHCNAFRVFDGEGEGIPGLAIDNFNGHWVVQTTGFADFPDRLREFAGQECESLWWKRLDQHDKKAPLQISGRHSGAPFLIEENRILYEIDFMAGYSQGLFLDQRENRARVGKRLASGQRLLNCFAYTCGFSVVGAAVGAITTSIDLSRPYLEWGKRNFEANGLPPEEHFFCRGDVFEWLAQFRKKGRVFTGIVLDPPTFSRTPKKKAVFRVEEDYERLVEMAGALLQPDGWMLCCCNEKRMALADFERQVEGGQQAFGRKETKMKSLQMPFDFNGSNYLKSIWIDR
ncbi:MAG: class I SAM-dependent methyltransferase [Verrucomicrobiota bacterium]